MSGFMKALVLEDLHALRLKDVPIPPYARNEILIRTKAATICTTDIFEINENPFNMPLPVVMGHEGAGIVAAAGEEVTGFRAGDEVAVHPVMPCLRCASCLRGLAHLCDNLEHLGFNRVGVFAEYFVTRPDRVRLKPPSMSFAHATLMEPVCVCLEAVERANITGDTRVLILGDGPFGIMMSKLCSLKKPKQLILTGQHEYRLSKAAAQTLNERQEADINGAVMALTHNEGIDSAILCVSSPAAVDTTLAVLRSRGILVVFSCLSGKTPVDLQRVHLKELTITGSCNDMDFLDEAMRLLADSALGLGGAITHEMPFEQWEEAFYQAEHGKCGGLKVSMVFK
jgi:threonine dehydrogenase-like Zn-dependent dehydrogenase